MLRSRLIYRFRRWIPWKLVVRWNRWRLSRLRVPSQLTYFVTNRCNCRCPHCFVDHTPGDELGMEQIGKIAASMRGHLKRLVLTGGEPFLRDVSEIVRVFKEQADCRQYVVCTNGLCWPETWHLIDATMDRGVRLWLQISLDGREWVHDAIRGRGAWKNVTWMLNRLYGVRQTYGHIQGVTIVGMLTQQTIHEVPYIVGTAGRCGFDCEFNLVRGSWPLRDEELRSWATTAIHHTGAPCTLLEAMRQHKYHYQLEWYLNYKHGLPCVAGRRDAVLWQDGRVTICEPRGEPYAHLKEFDWDLPKLLAAHRIDTKSCRCAHDCAIITAMPYDEDAMRGITAC